MGAIALTGFASAASAADWTGWYGGLNAGWERTSTNNGMIFPNTAVYADPYEAQVAALNSGRFSKSGFTGGVQLGYNLQQSNIVYGLETDFNWLGARPSRRLNVAPAAFPAFPFIATDSASANWMLTLRGRLGVAVTPTVLLYGTGGLAVARVRTSHTFNDNIPPAFISADSASDTKAGWTLGGGGEVSLNTRWSVKGEYLYAKFNNVGSNGILVFSTTGAPVVPTVAIGHSNDIGVHVFRVGVNYHFGWFGAP